jgi:zinc protease
MPKRLAILLVLVVPATLDASPPEPKAPELALESYRLPNGLKVALHRDPSVPRVTVAVAYHVGSKNERAGRTGFAHFFEHMMFRGTRNNPNYDIPLQETGAQSNAFTSEDMTVYFETVPTPFLERALYLEAERLAFLDSALDQEKFDTEREVVKNERRQSFENVPYGLAEETILANLFPAGHPYSWSVIGSMKDLGAASLDDLKQFFHEYYTPANATLVLAGDFDPSQARQLIARYFGPLSAGKPPVGVKPVEMPAVAKRIEQTDRVQLPRIYWSWPTVRDDHPDAAALDLLATILASGDASRLQKALVREKRLAKDVSADSDTKEVAGLFQIRTTAVEGKTIEDIEEALAEEIRKIQAEPPTDAELARALASFEKATYAALTSPLMRAVTLAIGFAQKDDPEWYRKEFARYFQVKPADIQRVAQRYLKPEKVALLVRPAKPGEEETPAVETGPPAETSRESAAADREPKAGPDWSKLPGPSDAQPYQTPRFVRKTLSNGIDVWIAPWKVLPVVEISLSVPVGTADDPKGQSGLAALTARLLDQGTESKTAVELAEALEGLGTTLGVATSPDRTTYNLGVLARNLDPALGLLGEVLAGPRFDPEDVDRERTLQLAALKQGPDSPEWIAQRAFGILLHGPDHPYGNPGQGYAETVAKLTTDDVKGFHHDHFGPSGATLIVVGDVDPEALTAKLEATLGRWTGAASEAKARPAVGREPESGVLYLVDKPGAVQSVIRIGRTWRDRQDEGYFATLLGNRVLGADFLSRLNQNLREQHGYSYGAGSGFGFRRKGSTWVAVSSVRADATASALREMLNELDALTASGKRPLSPEEIATAIDAESRSFPETFESPRGIAGALAELAEFGLSEDYLDTFLGKLGGTKPEAIARAMAEVVDPSRRLILVVGDRKTIEPKLREMGFEAIRVVTPDGVPVEPK